MGMKRTTIWLNEEDRKAIQAIRGKYGLGNDSSAIRLALRILASSDVSSRVVAEVATPRRKTPTEKE